MPSESNTRPTDLAAQRCAQLTLLLLALKALKSREELIADQKSTASQSVCRSDQPEDCKTGNCDAFTVAVRSHDNLRETGRCWQQRIESVAQRVTNCDNKHVIVMTKC